MASDWRRRWRTGMQPDSVAFIDYRGWRLNAGGIVLAIGHFLRLDKYRIQQHDIVGRRFSVNLDNLHGEGLQRGGWGQFRECTSVRYDFRRASGSGGGKREWPH